MTVIALRAPYTFMLKACTEKGSVDGPVVRRPDGWLPVDTQYHYLREVLTGVDLGTYDIRVLSWLSDQSADILITVVSLLHRARLAGAR